FACQVRLIKFVGRHSACHPVLKGQIAGNRNTDKIHQIVPGEGHGQRQRSGKNHNLQRIYTRKALQEEAYKCHRQVQPNQDRNNVRCYFVNNARIYQGSAFKPLNQQEINNRGDAHSREERTETFESFRVVECEKQAEKVLKHRSAGKGNKNGKKNTRHNGYGAIEINIIQRFTDVVVLVD